MKHNNVGKVGRAAANGGSEVQMTSEDAKCGDCGGLWRLYELRGYRDFWSRVAPGEEIPAGDCPECGAFAYVVKDDSFQLMCPYCLNTIENGHESDCDRKGDN